MDEGWATAVAPDGFWFDERFWGLLKWTLVPTPIGERPRVDRADAHVLLHRGLLVSIQMDRPTGFLIERRLGVPHFIIDGINERVVYRCTLMHRMVDCVEAHLL